MQLRTMQLNRTMRRAGITVTAAALGLLPAAGVAAAHDADSSSSSSSLDGRVVSVGSGNFVLQTERGNSVTVDTTGSTAYTELGNPAALSGVLDGEWVTISLDPSAQTPTATAVTVFPESVRGQVTGVSGSDVTLASRHGTETVMLAPSTAYVQKGATPTGVSTGEFVVASGLPDPGTPSVLDAQRVFIAAPTNPTPDQPQPQPQPPVTASTTPSWPVDHPPVPQGKPFEPSAGHVSDPQQPSGPPTSARGDTPETERFGGEQQASSPGAPQTMPQNTPQGGTESEGHGRSPGGVGDSSGGHGGGGFGH